MKLPELWHSDQGKRHCECHNWTIGTMYDSKASSFCNGLYTDLEGTILLFAFIISVLKIIAQFGHFKQNPCHAERRIFVFLISIQVPRL